ncbi:MAG TPA: hypothetical protein VNJ01_05730 [Bacteriovoracaceae bacterium]|nr:hypothetical protein [Bacteriovoracaceae bacterium]
MKSLLAIFFILSSLPLSRAASFEDDCREKIFKGKVILLFPQRAELHSQDDSPRLLVWSKGGFPAELSQQSRLGHLYLSRRKLAGKDVVICGVIADSNVIVISSLTQK